MSACVQRCSSMARLAVAAVLAAGALQAGAASDFNLGILTSRSGVTPPERRAAGNQEGAGLPAECHGRLHTDYAGDTAPVWGTNFKLADAGECCKACQAHHQLCGKAGSEGSEWWPDRPELKCGPNHHEACNLWVFCPEEQCFSFDIHKHLRGECWLKSQSLDPSKPRDPHLGMQHYPEGMRKAPRSIWPWAVSQDIWPGEMPRDIGWTSGVVGPPVGTIIESAEPHDNWRRRWCENNPRMCNEGDLGVPAKLDA